MLVLLMQHRVMCMFPVERIGIIPIHGQYYVKIQRNHIESGLDYLVSTFVHFNKHQSEVTSGKWIN